MLPMGFGLSTSIVNSSSELAFNLVDYCISSISTALSFISFNFLTICFFLSWEGVEEGGGTKGMGPSVKLYT